MRGSFSGQEKLFVELVNLKTQAKYRFFPEEVSLIYNTKDTLICCYRDENIWKKSEFSLTDFSLVSETQEHISSFFKLLYHHADKTFSRIIYKDEGYFSYIFVQNTSEIEFTPKSFVRHNFQLELETLENSEKKYIDVWEASLT